MSLWVMLVLAFGPLGWGFPWWLWALAALEVFCGALDINERKARRTAAVRHLEDLARWARRQP